jgi:restriction system protein
MTPLILLLAFASGVIAGNLSVVTAIAAWRAFVGAVRFSSKRLSPAPIDLLQGSDSVGDHEPADQEVEPAANPDSEPCVPAGWIEFPAISAKSLPSYQLYGNSYFPEAMEVLAAIRDLDDASLPVVLGRLRRMSAYAFEELLAFCFWERGFQGRTSGQYSRDGGVDGYAVVDGENVIIQAKRWQAHVCNRHITALARTAHEHGARGVFCHTGKTGRLARQMARLHRMTIISGAPLVALVTGESFRVHWPRPRWLPPQPMPGDGVTPMPADGIPQEN